MSHRADFRKVQAALGVAVTGVPNDDTKQAFQSVWDNALAEFRSEARPATPDASRAAWLVPGSLFPIVGRPYTAAGISAYLDPIRFDQGFNPTGLTLHHTAEPSLEQRPAGFVTQHMHNLRNYYRGLGWSSGPHFFVDDDQIWPFTPLNHRGVHARSFNQHFIGIEMLGDYDDEDPWSGRGLAVLTTTKALILALQKKLGVSHSALNFHRDDPRTSKTCPGIRIKRPTLLTFLDR